MTKMITSAIAGVAALAVLSLPAQAQYMSSRDYDKDIVEMAAAAGQFNTLLAAARAAGLVEVLQSDGPFTVFAPTDDAFAKLPAGTVEELLKPENRDKLAAILKYHVVPGKYMAEDVVTRNRLDTAEGSALSVKMKDGKAYVDGAQIIKTDIPASNGVIHVIDSVVLPNDK
ncbi:MAG: fasciclin domain-containing protein [Gemmatimonadetes bacterium]|uniref:Fasciclin domain-containing protein n=1 Tax=Candidatus Kutchimonas denitrificans TaxID=3056748 RepID=A0AAE4Z8G9_9BACT|nr:fasciclin domain-containing protein [Gemmatimonadota bacterium]NIR74422.1 fasciclin domain-containing protein [Candidatus Kutchimonas denitrificans]NIS00818.1 fasciclin domain-containing protein [Gemmatimonadota bacterium]NIT66441.1 fasciclin domain-containing protein [Gemmatimonadota bacterium]NIU52072.1 fasciclin domain-containing protein [Gemmatimonadota bacterium]